MSIITKILSVEYVSLMVGLLVFMILYNLLSKKRVKKIKLAEMIQNTEMDIIRDIENDRRISQTTYGRFHEQYMRPYLHKDANSLEKISKLFGMNLDEISFKIREAHMEGKISAEEILSMKLIGYGGSIAMFLAATSMRFNFILIFIGIIFYFLGVIYPQSVIESKLRYKKYRIIRDLPDFLELLKSVTEAGLGIQEALTKVSDKKPGLLAEEFKKVMAETKTNGGQWALAMENMSLRNNIDELSDVVSDILISYEKGTPITRTLEKEAGMMRQIKNSKVQEKAKSLSIKIIIPVAIFSFLPLLALLISPVLIQMVKQM